MEWLTLVFLVPKSLMDVVLEKFLLDVMTEKEIKVGCAIQLVVPDTKELDQFAGLKLAQQNSQLNVEWVAQ
jgi:hypothetical protein